MNDLCEIKIWNKFKNKLRTSYRSPTSCSEVAERSPISRRPIADQSPTSFSDSHAPILTKLVGDRSVTCRRRIGDWSATLPGPVCDWFGRNEVPDQSPTSLQPRRDRSGTLLRPLRLVEIVSRGEVAKRLQRMSDWGLMHFITINRGQMKTHLFPVRNLYVKFHFLGILGEFIPSNYCQTVWLVTLHYIHVYFLIQSDLKMVYVS